MIGAKLKEQKELKKMSTNEIAEKSGIPASTISRILSGKTESASFDNICKIAIALGLSIDELIGIEKEPAKEQHPKELIELYESELKHERKLNRKLFIFIGVVFSVLMILLIYDALHGGVGYIRY